MFEHEQLSKTEMLRLDQDRMIDSIKLGWTPDDIKQFWNWTTQHYNAIFRLVYEEVKDYIKLDNPQNLDTEIMRVFETNAKRPKAKIWVDTKTGKQWNDVSEFWGI